MFWIALICTTGCVGPQDDLSRPVRPATVSPAVPGFAAATLPDQVFRKILVAAYSSLQRSAGAPMPVKPKPEKTWSITWSASITAPGCTQRFVPRCIRAQHGSMTTYRCVRIYVTASVSLDVFFAYIHLTGVCRTKSRYQKILPTTVDGGRRLAKVRFLKPGPHADHQRASRQR